VINGAHAIIYSSEPDEVRALFRDVFELDSVDAGGGWLIFALPPAEVAVHPTEAESRHELYLMCDDIDATVAALAERGIGLAGPVTDQGWGRVTAIELPGGGELGIYEPRHPTAHGNE
jgi:predicted enzyme related to lactoylglutathione lyase